VTESRGRQDITLLDVSFRRVLMGLMHVCQFFTTSLRAIQQEYKTCLVGMGEASGMKTPCFSPCFDWINGEKKGKEGKKKEWCVTFRLSENN
jgi:hypothetical protein